MAGRRLMPGGAEAPSALALGNAALRAGRLAEALQHYEVALREQPALAPMIEANVALARRFLAPDAADTPVLQVGRLAVPEAPVAEARRDVVVLWKQNDSGLYGRRHEMVARYFASRPDVRGVWLFDYPITAAMLRRLGESAVAHTHHGHIHALTQARVRGALDTARLKQRVVLFDADSVDAEVHAATVRRVLAGEGVDVANGLLVVYPHNALALAVCDALRPWRVLVDVVDDARTWPGVSAAARARMNEGYRRLLQRADAVWTNCAAMQHEVRQWCVAPRLVPNGCDVEGAAVTLEQDAAFAQFCAWPGPTLGYVGNLKDRLDTSLLARLAASFPHCQIALIGSAHANEAVLGLRRFANVCLPGVVPYAQIGAWVQHFDVGLLPHRDTEMTRRMHPLKQYLYLRYRVPVVASGIDNLEPWPGWVYRAEGDRAFLDRVRQLLAKPPYLTPEEEEAFAARLAAVSWPSRLQAAADAVLGVAE